MSKVMKVLLIGAIALAAVLSVGGAMTSANADCIQPRGCVDAIQLYKIDWCRISSYRCVLLRFDLIRLLARPSADCTLALPYANVAPTDDGDSGRWAEYATVCLINQERAARSLAPLAISNPLADGARQHSHDLSAGSSGLNHDGMADRIRNAGFSGGGEDVHSVRGNDTKMIYNADGTIRDCPAPNNVPNGQPNSTPHDIVANWMCSPGHAANILMASATHIGVGMAIGDAWSTNDSQSSGELAPPATYTAEFAY